MNRLLLAPIAATCLAVSACGYSVFDAADDISHAGFSELDDAEPIPSQATEVAQFDELGVLGPDRVVFTSGNRFTIRAEVPAEILPHLRYRMKNGSITVGRESGNWNNKGAATIYLTAPSLKSISAMGSAAVEADRMHGDAIEIANAGSGSVKVADVQAKGLEVSIAGSGNTSLAGQAASSEISVAGSGDVDAAGLTSANNEVSIAGSGSVKLRSDGRVEANIMGSGDVTVLGNARCQLSSMGSGKLHCGG